MARQWYNLRWNDSKKNDIDFVECGNQNCDNKFIKISDYECQSLRNDTPPEHIHYVCQPRLQDVVIICSKCGHFTVFEP